MAALKCEHRVEGFVGGVAHVPLVLRSLGVTSSEGGGVKDTWVPLA